MAELTFFRRGEELMRVQLPARRIVIGRGGGATVTIPHAEVSRAHAAIEPDGEGHRVVDLSGRGTMRGAERLEQAALRDGDELSFGDFRALYRREAGAVAEETNAGRDHTRAIHARAKVPMGAVLRVHDRGGERLIPIGDELSLGKGDGCTVRLEDSFASGVHARLVRAGGGLLLFDLDSTNGTWVNGLRVGQAELQLGSSIRVGETELTLEPPPSEQPASFEGLVSSHPAMREVFELLGRVAPSVAPVAIFGETGTGKELVANAIHARSERAGGPFVPVNCAAISSELVESELFGHEKGAFTGAVAARKGAFEEAAGGTIFLDEIGELSADVQAKLLRTLELGEIRRVGSARPFRVDVRVVCATHVDLRAAVRRGAFREDLYYRLCVIRVELPPLRARASDLPQLCAHFLGALAPRGTRPVIEEAAAARLAAHDWPGNVRELRNVLSRALLLRRGPQIAAADVLFDAEPEGGVLAPRSVAGAPPDEDELVRLPGRTLEEIENEAFAKSMKRHGNNRRKVARELGLARSTTQRKAQELGFRDAPDD